MSHKEMVEEFIANLLIAGFSQETVCEKGYDYALALQTDQQIAGVSYVPASFMREAACLVRAAMPGAYRTYEMNKRR